eukprot:2191672-Prymnesium_polylepis.1
MVDDARTELCFKPKLKKPKADEEQIQALKATHLLVLQVACIHDLSSYSEVRPPAITARPPRRAIPTPMPIRPVESARTLVSSSGRSA